MLFRRRDLLTCTAAGLLFGFSCLIRINNIFFAPLFLFLVFSQEQNKKLCWKGILSAAAAFWIIFTPQLIINKLHFGSIFTFPYVLHNPDVAKGFLAEMFLGGAKFLMSVNYFYFMLGSISLLFIKDNCWRRILLIWIIPLTFFFCGYPEIGNNGIRFLFPVYGALTASFFAAELWKSCSAKAFWIMISALTIQVLFTAPSNYTYTKLLPWNLQYFSSGVLISQILSVGCPIFSLTSAIFFFKQKRMAYFTILFSVAYAAGFIFLPIIIFILLILKEIWILWEDFSNNRDMKRIQ